MENYWSLSDIQNLDEFTFPAKIEYQGSGLSSIWNYQKIGGKCMKYMVSGHQPLSNIGQLPVILES